MKRSKFSLSSTHLLSGDMGELIPINMLETLPGDSIQAATTALVRCAPMLSPPMHPVRVRLHHWFVPYRLIWSNFEPFITGGPDGNNASVFPTWAGGAVTQGSLANYLGLPVTTVPAVSALPFRAYNLIWNEYYRDQDLQTPLVISLGDGNDTTTSRVLQNACWEKDYFTSARPWEQKGTAVTIPISGSGSVVTNSQNIELRASGTPSTDRLANYSNDAQSKFQIPINANAENVRFGTQTGLQATFSAAGITVNALRQTLAIQRFQEARANYGSRYPEYLRALGVTSSDARLNRPEYLGGGVQTIQFSEVVQSAADGANPVSTLRGHGITAMRSNRFRRFFEEHGLVITLLSVLPKTIYSNGLERSWNRRSKYDFWQRELENLGQQPIANKEIRANHATPDGVFGYQDRYDEYRRQWSRVSGEFSQSTLNYWHFARDFATDPALNSTFVSAVPPERPFAAPAADVLYIQAQHSVQARRLLSFKASPRTF